MSARLASCVRCAEIPGWVKFIDRRGAERLKRCSCWLAAHPKPEPKTKKRKDGRALAAGGDE